MVNIEINGIPVQARDGAMLIEAADEAGINIPRFCYHKKLSVAANCRMCLVDVEKAPKAMPACATPVSEGMKVFTRSSKALRAQKSVMEFLLINHPLDCPICDQGGECQLQEVAMGYGQDVSRFVEKKRVIKDKNIGPLIATEMTRCIHCTRCVRFGQEIAGVRELGATGRGEHMEIGTYIEKSIDSEMSGNIIDLCPVGALTSKPYRYKARPWELQQHASIAAHDCVGSNILIETRRNELMRVLPQENENINEVWLSDRDRFSYQGVNSKHRLLVPQIKVDGKWEETDWNAALDFVVARLRHTLQGGSDKLGALISPNATIEEMYLAQKLLRGLGSNSIDHRLGQSDFREQDKAPLFPYLGSSVAGLERQDAVLIVGGNVRKAQPIVNHRLRKAAMQGAKMMFINPLDYELNYPVAEKCIVAPRHMTTELAAVAKALLNISGEAAPADFATWMENIDVTDAHLQMAEHLHTGDRALVLLGDQAQSMEDYSVLHGLAQLVGRLARAHLGYLTPGANAVGAWLAGAVPHRGVAGARLNNSAGLHTQEMLQGGGRGFITLGVEPELDTYNCQLALNAMKNSDCVIALTAFDSESMRSYADVMLPIATHTETSGTFVNAEAQWQSFRPALTAQGEARPAWKILRVLGNMFDVSGFDYMSSDEVRDELFAQVEGADMLDAESFSLARSETVSSSTIYRIGEMTPYACDALVRRAKSLQTTHDGDVAGIYINERLAERLSMSEGDMVTAEQGGQGCRLPLKIDNRLPDDCSWVAAGHAFSTNLGGRYAPLTLKKS